MNEGPYISKSVYEIGTGQPSPQKQKTITKDKTEKPSLWNKILSDVAQKDG